MSASSVSFSVTPLFLNLGLREVGETFETSIVVNNTGTDAANFVVEVASGGSADASWISVSPTDFTLNSGESKSIAVTISLPATASPGSYYYLLTVKPVSENSESVGLGVALTSTISFTIAGVKLEAIIPDDIPKDQQKATLLFRNYQNQSVIAEARFQVFDGASVITDEHGDSHSLGAFGSANQSYQTFWDFIFSTSSLNGTYLGLFTVTYHPIGNESNTNEIQLQKSFVVGFIDGSVEVNVIESRAAFEPTTVQFIVTNRGTLPFSVHVNASLINLETGESFGNYFNYEIRASPSNKTTVNLLLVPPDLGNYSVNLRYQFLGKSEQRTFYLSVYVPPTFPITSVPSSGNADNFNGGLVVGGAGVNGIIPIVLAALGGMLVGFTAARMMTSSRKKTTSRQRTIGLDHARRPAKLLGLLVQRVDGTDLYSRRFTTAVEYDPSLLSGLIGSMMALSEEIFHRSSLKKVEIGNFQLLIARGQFVNIIFITTAGSIEALEEVQNRILEFIEDEGREILQQMLVDSQEMERIWTTCEEIIRSSLS